MKNLAMALFIVVESILYFIFLVRDIMQLPTTNIKYLSIFLCFFVSIYLCVRKGIGVLFVAMLFTLIADTFLLLRNDNYEAGVLAFCVVQTIYAYVLILRSNRKSVIPRLIIYGIALMVLYWMDMLDMLTVLSAWSFTQLTANVVHGFAICYNGIKDSIRQRLFAIGLLLFLGCDICVGIHNMTSYISNFPYPNLVLSASFGMWFFYLPSQVLIVTSFWDNK